ncbi:hypothetical protein ACJX0J_041321, partial [Zea mays]
MDLRGDIFQGLFTAAAVYRGPNMGGGGGGGGVGIYISLLTLGHITDTSVSFLVIRW